jgi:septation ring formation regulator EzrA
MQIFDKQSVGDLLLMDVLADLHRVKRKLAHYAGKYGGDVTQFEARVNSENESFEHYDELIEWKAYQAACDDLVERIEELKHGRFQVA